jgi:hypothetical protein
MPRSRRAATLTTVIVLGAACGHPSATVSVPFVAEQGVPARPPVARLIVDSDDGETVVPGVLYTTDWRTRDVADATRPRVPVPWPSRSASGRANAISLEFGSSISPDYVVVQTFAKPAGADRVPGESPVTTFECSRFAAPRCVPSKIKSRLRVRLDLDVLSGGYITAFGAWHVPAALRRTGSDSPAQVSASWLFRASEEDPLKASGR